MKRGSKPKPVVTGTLAELLKTPCPDGFCPWIVSVERIENFTYARSKEGAITNVMSNWAWARICYPEEIINAHKENMKEV